MKKVIDKKKKYLILGAEIVVLTAVIQWSFTDGFTKSLDEALGLSNSGAGGHLFGSLDVQKALISLLVITVFFVTVYLFNKVSKHENRH